MVHLAVPEWITLLPAQVDDARAMAASTYERYRNHRGHYQNSSRSHFLGKIGEIGVESWLLADGIAVDAAFRDDTRDREPDVRIGSKAYDVKTWSPEYWDLLGRCVTPRQLETKFARCDGVIWAVGIIDLDPIRVGIMGWSSVSDIRAAPIRMTGPSGRQIANHQIETEDLRPLSSLSD
jgi:hypothetical protein